MSRFRYNFNVLTNRKAFRDLKEDSPLLKLLEVIRSEIAGSTKVVPDEDIGDGDGSNKEFSGTLAHPGAKPGTLVIHAVVVGDTTETFTDKGDGTLVSDLGGMGSIDYASGKYSVEFNTAPKNGEDIYACYVGDFTIYKPFSDEDVGTGDGTSLEFSGTLAHPGIKPGSLEIRAPVVGGGTEVFTDNGDGTLVSDATPPGSGTINYSSGAFSVTFTNAPADGEDVLASYFGSTLHYQFTADGLNPVYDVRFINYASGQALDYWGETLDLPRSYTGKAMESDADYRVRLLAELRDFTEALMVETVKEKVESVLGTGKIPEVTELWVLAPDWPITWCNDDPDKVFTTWVPWDGLVDFLVVLKPGTVDDEVIGTGEDPPKYTFTGNLSQTPVKKKSITIADFSEDETFTDDGKGNLSSGEGGSGTIDYDTGAYSVTFIIPPENGENVLADYQVLADPDEEYLDDIAEFLIEVKFAPSRILIVDDSGGEYYILRKKVL